MPLSRLSARRNRDGLVRQRTEKSGIANDASSRHLRLWEAIRRTRDELNQWQTRADQVDTLFRTVILPREHRLTAAYCDLTDVLMTRFANASLSNADRSLIGLWITENLRSLQSHPFVDNSHRDRLMVNWNDVIGIDAPIENQLARLARQYSLLPEIASDSAVNSTDISADYEDTDEDDIVFDFGWHRSSSRTNAAADEPALADDEEPEAQRPDKGKSEHQQEEAQNREKVDATVSLLEKRLSVDRLFRQLARVLHPDREQDETLKAEKHSLMSQCLQARQNKDINTLLNLYCEHVGELPDDLTDDSHEELVAALQLQLKQLQQEFREKRFGDPLHTQIVERYGANDSDTCEQRIAQHAQSLDVQIQQVRKRIDDVQSHDGLQNALVERRAVELDRMAIDEITGLHS